MKKLKLVALELGAKEVLTREQLKKMAGGDGSGGTGTCGAYLPAGTSFQCGWSAAAACYDGSYYTIVQISKDTAQCLTNGVSGAHWCCDQCPTTSWYTNCHA